MTTTHTQCLPDAVEAVTAALYTHAYDHTAWAEYAVEDDEQEQVDEALRLVERCYRALVELAGADEANLAKQRAFERASRRVHGD